jgi:hypothetical protein
VAGYSNSDDNDVSGNHGGADFWIVKLSNSGNLQWQKCLGGSTSEFAGCIYQTLDGGYILAGQSNSNDGDVSGNHGNNDAWIVKLSPYTGIDEFLIHENPFTLSPNPAISTSILQLNFTLKDAEVIIYDFLGKEMIRKNISGNRIELGQGNLGSGVYLVRLRNQESEYVQKLIIE